MARQEIRVLIDAEALCNHTLRLTGNLNNFPKKYRFTLVDELVRKSIEIYDRIQDANSTWDTQKRIEGISAAISSCHKLKMLLRLTQEVLHPSCSISYWDKMVDDVECQLMAWKKQTQKR